MRDPYTGLMDGSVRVLLVSAGASPDALVAELERLGVEITPCSFAEAEEYLETDPPDLVALAGALGAVELANMIDDLDDGPRMVIVAERKELAKLRGLNREVVVSLFAMETTEKVVGQRIESLARRAARRRDHKATEAAPANKTSLGLPSAAHFAKADVKRGQPPPHSRPPAPPSEEPFEAPFQKNEQVASAPTEVGEKAGAQREMAPDVVEKAAPALSKKAAPGGVEKPIPGAKGKSAVESGEKKTPAFEVGGGEVSPPSREAARALSAPRNESEGRAPVEVAKPTIPERTRASKEDAEQSIMVIDEDLLESILPDPPVDEIPELSMLSMISIPPDVEESPVSIPPTLPPAAKAQVNKAPALKLTASPGELDIADAEHALDNLDSVKLEITQDLVAQAQEEMGRGREEPEKPSVNESEKEKLASRPEAQESENKTEPVSADVQGTPADSKGSKEAPVEAARFALDQTIAFSDLQASFGDLGNDEPTKVGGVEDSPPDPSGTSAELERTAARARDANVLSEATREIPVKRRSGARIVGALAVVGAALGGLYFVQSSRPETSASPAHDSAQPVAAPASATQEGRKTEPTAAKPDPAPPSNRPTAEADGEATPAPSAPSADSVSAASQAGEVETPPAAPDETAQPSSPKPHSPPLENPFKRTEKAAPTCETLLSGAVPTRGPDPVSEASAAWDKARAAIVGGKLEDAHKYMCEAVAINPESAAVEGLAAHYLNLGAYSEALRFANKAESLRPGQKDIGNLLGDVYAMMGDIEKARDTWLNLLNVRADEAARLAPISKDYSVEGGRHLRRGDLVRAEIFYRRAVILDPQNLNGIIGLAKVYHRMEMPAYARAFCEMSLKLSDVIPEVHVLLGELALAEGNREDARARFERALAVRPDFFPAKRGLSQVK